MPSRASDKLIAAMQVKVENIEKEMAEFKSDVKEDFAALHAKMDKFIDSAERRFANKWVERALLTAIGIAGTVLIGYAIKVIYNIPI